MHTPIEVITTTWAHDEVTLRALREEVFIKEQNVPPDLEWDEHDETSIHFLVFNEQHEPIGTARLMRTGQLGRMAVLAPHRGKGFGGALLRRAIKEAQREGMDEIVLFAQTHALPFYEKFGFAAFGDEFMDAGIAHRQMRMSLRVLPQSNTPTQKGLPDLNTVTLGENRISFLLDNSGDFAAILIHLIAQAHTSVRILSADLDYALFDNESFVTHLSKMLTNNPRGYFKMLVHTADSLAERPHRLIPLARRLTSSIQIKKCNPKYASPGAVYVIIDNVGLLYRPNFETYDGFANANYPRKCKELLNDFDYLWEHALFEDNLRTFTL